MTGFWFRTGAARIPFDENYRIARENVLHGRPFDEGMLPAEHIPDPRFPEWVWVEVAA